MAIFEDLDRALRWLREGRRIRQYQVAEAAGITKAMLSAYETGKQKPSLDTLDKILLALDSDLVELQNALAVFRAPPGEGPPLPRGVRATGRPRSGDREPPTSGPGPLDVSSTLGIDPPLDAGEEEALGEVLASFHKLLRHLHASARQAGQGGGED